MRDTHEKIIRYSNWTIKLFIAVACLTFVVYQSHACISRYLDGPQGTLLDIEFAKKHSYPSITICTIPEFNIGTDVPYNRSNLNFCGLKNSKK